MIVGRMSAKLALEGGEPVRKAPLPFDARVGLPSIDEEEIDAVVGVLKSKRLTQLAGSEVRKFERQFEEYEGIKHAIAVSSGTAALHVALAALGIGCGDEVIVPAHSFIATAMSVVHQNAIPIFADITDKEPYNIDCKDVEKRISSRTKAIVPVHWHGHPVDMDPLIDLAEKNNVSVIEDCAQATGAEYRGKKTGTLGDVGCFSFYQTKNMTTGEGGMLTTNNDELAENARMIRHHGEREEAARTYHHVMIGYNYRMGAMQAAVGQVQLAKLDKMNNKRMENANYLTQHLRGIDGIEPPRVEPYAKHSFYIYHLRISQKLGMTQARVIESLNAEGIPTIPGPSIPLYMQPVFMEKRGYGHTHCPWDCSHYTGRVEYRAGDCPNAEMLDNTLVCPPMSPELTKNDLDDIIAAFTKIANHVKPNLH